MIEDFRGGLPRSRVDGAVMAAMAGLPFRVWDCDDDAWLGVDGISNTRDAGLAGRWTLADAYFATSPAADNETEIIFLPSDYIILDVPMPLSTNALFCDAPNPKGPRSRIKTREYKAWIDAAIWALKPQLTAQRAPAMPQTPIFGDHWAVWIRLNIDHKSDVTNRVKAVEDVIVKWNITTGDNWNDRCTVERDQTLPVECRVVVYQKVQP